MFEATKIQDELNGLQRHRKHQDSLVYEAKRILTRDLFAENKILENLGQYNQSFELVDEEEVETTKVFIPSEIKKVCIRHRLKFLDSSLYKTEIPYEAVLKIKHINLHHKKELKQFKVLALPTAFTNKPDDSEALLFAKTNYGNYYLVHRWGNALKWNRKFKFWPLRNFETLGLTVIIFTLTITLLLPTELITLDRKADYFSGYRAAAFFHLLIFNTGVTAYITFAFAKNFSSTIWNQKNDFD